MLTVDTIPLCALPISNFRLPISKAYRMLSIGTWQSSVRYALLRFFVIRVLTAAPAELLKLQTVRSCLLVLGRYVIAAFAITALQHNIIAWHISFPIGTHASSVLLGYARLRRALFLNRTPEACEPGYSTTSDTVPAPTVRPPSRIAKRKPFSIAIGAINSISICTLSPGITISTPCGRCATPVTSVVRK